MRTIVCQCAHARVLSPNALQRLRESGEPLEAVADLCEQVAHGKFTATAPLKVYACHPRAVKHLLASAGIAPQHVEAVDLRAPTTATATTPGAWFPVIDFDRCTHCLQCLSFCLFGVFAAKDGRIRVTQPDNCKPNCPACARVCPEAAIIFPKHPEPIIHGGDGPRSKVDVSALLGGDVYQTLRRRSRFDKDRDAVTAHAERCACLAKLQKHLGIPPEVLRDLNVESLQKDP
jgi:NAD-dependent dihydropyrimidine dehydrogenase PreA subunit